MEPVPGGLSVAFKDLGGVGVDLGQTLSLLGNTDGLGGTENLVSVAEIQF